MEKAMEQKQAAGIVALAIKDGQVIWHDSAGMKNIAKQQRCQRMRCSGSPA